MNKKYLSQDKWMNGIGEIADCYILEAVNYSKQKRVSRRYIGAAALVFLCICAAMFLWAYRGNLRMKDGKKTVSVKQENDGSKQSKKHTGALSVIAYAAAAEGGQGTEQGKKLEEDVEVSFSEYSPAMSHVPDMPFSFTYSEDGKTVEIKVSASHGMLRKYTVDGDASWHVSEEGEVLRCKSGEKIYWGPAEGEQEESVLTVEVFQADISLEKKEISIKWDADALCYTALLKSKEGMASSQEIISEAMKFTQRIEVYAPDLLVCNQNYLAFANLKGMIIYDQKEEKVASVIDLQEMDCNNFLSDSRHTCVFMEGNEIVLFNMKSGKVEQNYYRCSFPNGLEEPKIELLATKGNKQELKKKYQDYQKKWQESDYQKMYEKYIEKWSMYSEYGIRWKNEQGERMRSTLLIEYSDLEKQEIYYSVLQENLDRGSWEKQKLNIDVVVAEEENSTEKLPDYQYTGKSEIKKAVYNYVILDWPDRFDKLHLSENDSDVIVPFLTKSYGVFDKGDKVVFFGHMVLEQYVQIGDILESVSGGGRYFKAVLQKEGEGYSVKRFQIAEGDGAMLRDSIDRLMKGYPEAKKRLESAWQKSQNGTGEEERKRVIRQYVKDNGLMIHYYKDYGWDKVKLSD